MKPVIELLNFADAQITIRAEAAQRKNDALEALSEIVEIQDDFDNQCAVTASRDVKAIIAEVEACRKAVKAPVLELGKSIDQAAKEFAGELQTELARVNRLLSDYATEQRRIAFEAERKRQEEQRKLEAEKAAAAEKLRQAETAEEVKEARQAVAEKVKAEADIKAIEIKPAKAEGLTVRQVKDFRIVDIMATLKARSDLVHVTPNRMAILAAIKETDSIPGLEIFTETKTSVRK